MKLPLTVRRFGALALANGSAPIAGIATAPIIARALGPADRGEFAAISNLILICAAAATMGVQDGLTHFVARHFLSTRGGLTFALRSLPTLCAVNAPWILVLAWLTLHRNSSAWRAFLVAAPTLAICILSNVLLGLATGMDPRTATIARIGGPLARLVAVCLLLPFKSGINLMSLSISVGLAPLAAVVYVAVRASRIRDEAHSREPVDQPGYTLWRYSLLAWPGVIAALSTSRIDQIVGLPLLGRYQLGLYAAAVTIAEVPLVIGMAAKQLIFGATARRPTALQSRIALLCVSSTVIACLVMDALASTLVPVVFGDPFRESSTPIVVLSAGTVAASITFVYSGLLQWHGHVGIQSVALCVGSAASIGALIWFSRWGAIGAAIASDIGYVLACAMTLGFARARLAQPLWRYAFGRARDPIPLPGA